MQSELAFAHKMTAILYQKLAGNPRRIKRFLNDMSVRRSIAARRGIELENEVVAKLMVLEVLLPEQFKVVLSWLRGGELRDRLTVLERIANNAESETTDNSGSEPTTEAGTEGAGKSGRTRIRRPTGLMPRRARRKRRRQGLSRRPPRRRRRLRRSSPRAAPKTASPSAAIRPRLNRRHVSGPWLRRRPRRWAKLDPLLAEVNLSPDLHLAASFSGDLLVSDELPSASAMSPLSSQSPAPSAPRPPTSRPHVSRSMTPSR